MDPSLVTDVWTLAAMPGGSLVTDQVDDDSDPIAYFKVWPEHRAGVPIERVMFAPVPTSNPKGLPRQEWTEELEELSSQRFCTSEGFLDALVAKGMFVEAQTLVHVRTV